MFRRGLQNVHSFLKFEQMHTHEKLNIAFLNCKYSYVNYKYNGILSANQLYHKPIVMKPWTCDYWKFENFYAIQIKGQNK